MPNPHTTAPDAAPETATKTPASQTPDRSRALYLLREFVLEPLLGGVLVLLLIGGVGVLTYFLCGGAR